MARELETFFIQDLLPTIAGTDVVIPEIRTAVVDPDAAAQAATKIIEGSLGSLVTAFQRFAEAKYPLLPQPSTKVRRNTFQNLDEGSTLWSAAGGHPYAQTLTANEMRDLVRLFQQRHLIAHREGLVDKDYIYRSGDTSYQVGQRIVIKEQAVLRLAELLEKLVAQLAIHAK